MKKTLQEKRITRKKKTAEDFTPPKLVNEMLDKLIEYGKTSVTDEDKTFLDPACGNGNILVEVLKRKLSLGHDPSKALSTLYGCDIMRDNIRECRLRLLAILRDANVEITRDHVKTMFNHIVVTSFKTYTNGALDYEFSFENKSSAKDVILWMEGIEKKQWLDNPASSTIEMSKVDDEMEDAKEFSIFD
jgi:hypothetical protein